MLHRCDILIGPVTSPAARVADAHAGAGGFAIEDDRLVPDWIRLRSPGLISLRNPCGKENTVVINTVEQVSLAPCEERTLAMQPGVHQLLVRTEGFRTRSSFALVDTVAEAK
jgi:hypothetical protein